MRRVKLFSIYAVIAVFALALSGCGEDYGDDYDYEYEEDYADEYEGGNEYDYEDDYDEGYEYDNQSEEYSSEEYDDYDSNEVASSGNASFSGAGNSLGSCSEMAGTTVLVSIFLDDANSSWASNPSAIDDALNYTGIATNWISKQAAAYGCNSNFIYDWKANSDLYYEGSVGTNMTDEENADGAAWGFINANVDSQALLQKYNADNIGFMFYINTPLSNNNTSCTRNYYEGMEYPYEMCLIYMFCDNEEESPASIAHEILHLFGAPDLYSADTDGDNYGVPQELVDELESTKSNDIMFTTYDAKKDVPYYDKITNDFTEVDAYYVGLTDSCDFVNQWNLQPSQHR